MNNWMRNPANLLKKTGGNFAYPQHEEMVKKMVFRGICTEAQMTAEHLCFSDSADVTALFEKADHVKVGALIIEENTDLPPKAPQTPVIRVKNILQAITGLLVARTSTIEVSELATVHPTATIGENVRIGPFCFVGAYVNIGAGTELHPRVVLYEGASIGESCVLHSGAIVREFCKIGDKNTLQNGAIVGADGFGYFPDPQKGLQPVPQIGIVETGKSVYLGANSCIDRGTFGSTKIGDKTHISNLVQIGHNNEIGEACTLESQVGVAGSCKIGRKSKLGQAVKVRDHLKIGEQVNIEPGSLVYTNLESNGSYAGEGPYTSEEWQAIRTELNKLPIRKK